MLDIRFLIRFALIVLLTGITACSIQSRQLNAVQGLISDRSNPLEDAQWSANWNGSTFDLYAINAPEETIFGYEQRLRIHFNGWNITQTIGILPSENGGRIELQGSELLYFVNDRLIARHQCQPWITSENQVGSRAKGVEYIQFCAGREAYTNRIDVDSEGFITRLEFLIHPEYPMLTMNSVN